MSTRRWLPAGGRPSTDHRCCAFGLGLVVVMAALMVGLTGCGPLGAGKRVTTVHVWAGEEPDSFDPFTTERSSVSSVMHLVYSGLIKRDASGTPLPDLVSRMPDRSNGGVSPDGRTIVYRLRPGLSFSDGSPLTSADAVATFRFARERARRGVIRQRWLDVVGSIDGPAPDIVRVRLVRPAVWAVPEVLPYVLPASSLDGDPDNLALWRAPVGSGPYKLAAWRPRAEMVFEVNRRYHGTRPHVGRLRVRYPKSRDLEKEFLESKSPVVWEWVPEGARRVIQDERPSALVRSWTDFYEGYVLRHDRGALADPRLRSAFARAFPRGLLADIDDRFLGPLPKGVVPRPVRPDSWAYRPQSPVGREDTRSAARMLDEAGWTARDKEGFRVKDGRRLTVTVGALLPFAADDTERVKLGMNGLRGVYRSLGWEIVYSAMGEDRFGAGYGLAGSLASGEYDIALAMLPGPADPLSGWPFDPADMPGLSRVFGANVTRIADPKMAALVEGAEGPTSQEVRRRRIHAVLDHVEAAPHVIVRRPWMKTDVVHRVENVVPSDGPWGDFWNVEEWRVRP